MEKREWEVGVGGREDKISEDKTRWNSSGNGNGNKETVKSIPKGELQKNEGSSFKGDV